MELFLITGSATTTHAHIKVHHYDQVDETNKTYVAYKNGTKKLVMKQNIMKVTSNTLNTTSIHFFVWCKDKEAGISAIRQAVSEKSVENYNRAKAIYDTVNGGMSIIESDDVVPESGDLKL